MIFVTLAPFGTRNVTPKLSSLLGEVSNPSVDPAAEDFADPELVDGLVDASPDERAGVVDERVDCGTFWFSLAGKDPRC